MYDNDELSNSNKDNDNLEDDDQNAEEQKKLQQAQEKHWAYKLFIEHPELYLPFLEQAKEKAVSEVEGICKIFDEYKMPKDSKILDLSCGIGRHSIPLAKRGYKVIGYDITSLYLKKAREWAKREGLVNNNDDIDDESESKSNSIPIKFYQGDLRNVAKILSEKGQTDINAIISMETSIGYFGEEANYRLFEDLTSICSYSAKSYSTSPILIIDTINRDYLIREFQPFGLEGISEEYLELHMKRKFNLESSSMQEEWKFYERGNKGEKRKNEVSPDDAVDLRQILNLHLNLRVYSLHEIIRLLKHAGWNCVSKYGDIATLEPFNRGSRNMVLVSQRTSNYDARL